MPIHVGSAYSRVYLMHDSSSLFRVNTSQQVEVRSSLVQDITTKKETTRMSPNGSLLVSTGLLGIFLRFQKPSDVMIPWLGIWCCFNHITITMPFPNLDFQWINVGIAWVRQH